MRKKWLLSQPACEPPEKIDGIACRAQVLTPNEADPFTYILNIDIYNFGHLAGRYFADKYKRESAAYVKGAWRRTNLLNSIDLIKYGTLDYTMANGYYRYAETGSKYFDSEEDEETVCRYIGGRLMEWEYEIRSDERTTAYKRKVERIDALMTQVPCTPSDMEDWIRQRAFFEEFLMTKKNEDGKRSIYCTACGAGWETDQKYRLGKKVTCPHCGKQVKVKGHADFSLSVGAILLQPLLGDWVERIFRAVTYYEFGKQPQLELFEEIRVVIPRKKTWGKCYYGQFGQADEFMQDWWDHNQKQKRFRKGFLYTANLESLRGIAPDSLFQSGIKELAEKGPFDVNKFVYSYKSRPYMEYLIKGRFYRLAENILDDYTWAMWGTNDISTPKCMNPEATKLTGLLQMDKNHLNRLRVKNGGVSMMEWLQYDENEEKVTDEALDFLEAAKLTVADLEYLIAEVGSVTKVVNYIKKQKVKPSAFLTEWKDYLRMAQAEGYDINDSIVRFPKDMKRRHDELLEVINERKNRQQAEERAKRNKKINDKILKQLPKAKRLFWENEKYMIIPAGKVEELEEEGRALHHCVGSSSVYKDRMAEGISWILFLRKKENLEKAYYTIEISLTDDKIMQYYSEFDRQPDKKEIDKLLSEYKKYLKKAKKPEVVVEIAPAAVRVLAAM